MADDDEAAVQAPVPDKKRWPKITAIIAGAAIVVAGAVGGGFALGHHSTTTVAAAAARTRPSATTTTSSSTTTTTGPYYETPPYTPPTTAPQTASVGTTISLTGQQGSSVDATLVEVANDSADTIGGGCLDGQDNAMVYVEMKLVNTGATVLTSGTNYLGSIGRAMSMVDSNAQPYSVNDCDRFGNTTMANADCATSVSVLDLSPGDSATVCPVFLVPSTITLNEVQFDASQAFGGFGSGLPEGIWHLGQS